MSQPLIPVSVNTAVDGKVPAHQMSTLNGGFTSATLCLDDIVAHILEGHALNPAHLDVDEHGRSVRKNAAFKQAQLVFLDIDNSVAVGSMKRRRTEAEGYMPLNRVVENSTIRESAYLIYTTPSHQGDWHRYRLVFALPEPLTDVERYKQILRAFITRVGADEACKSPVHIFYGNRDAEVYPYGNILSQDFVDRMLHWASNIDREERSAREHINGALTPDHVAAMLAVIPPKLDYVDWVRIISGIASKFDEETTVRLVEAWSPGNPGEVRYKVRHRMERIGIGTVIYIAKQHGYHLPKAVYKDSLLEEEAGVRYVGNAYRLTQSGNAERFVEAHKHHVRYCVEQDTWYVWNGRHLEADTSGVVGRLARDTFREIIHEAETITDPKHAEATLKWAKASESRANIDAALDLAHRGTEITVTADKLDQNPMTVNLRNGIFDLETLTLCEHDIDELNTRMIDIAYDEHAECPKWIEFLMRIFDGDRDVVEFMQRAVGYTLSGLTSEECLFFAYGSGANGKSLFFSVVDLLLGGTTGYAMKAKNDLIMMRRGDPGVPMDIAELRGRRFVYCDELPDTRRFDESKIKDITSHDKLTGRFLYERSFTFQPTHKLWIYGNHRPTITQQDDGIWRRIRLIPFTVTIPESERRPAEDMKAEFRAEASGILRWALEGFYRWKHEGGLTSPQSIREATEAYRSEMDTVGSFLAEEVMESAGSTLPHKVLYTRYKQWCQEQGVTFVLTSKKLSRYLLETKHWKGAVDRNNSREWRGYTTRIRDEYPGLSGHV